jgi:hypothetical protein
MGGLESGLKLSGGLAEALVEGDFVRVTASYRLFDGVIAL